MTATNNFLTINIDLVINMHQWLKSTHKGSVTPYAKLKKQKKNQAESDQNG